MSENYLGIMMRIISGTGNYDENYEWELSPSIKYHMEKLRFIGILAYPKII